MKRIFLLLITIAILTPHGSAHVGSPDVTLEGMACPYHLTVSVKPPDVIPGTAVITVWLDRPGAVTIGVQPIYYYSGLDGAPSPDALQQDPTPDQWQYRGSDLATKRMMRYGTSRFHLFLRRISVFPRGCDMKGPVPWRIRANSDSAR